MIGQEDMRVSIKRETVSAEEDKGEVEEEGETEESGTGGERWQGASGRWKVKSGGWRK